MTKQAQLTSGDTLTTKINPTTRVYVTETAITYHKAGENMPAYLIENFSSVSDVLSALKAQGVDLRKLRTVSYE